MRSTRRTPPSAVVRRLLGISAAVLALAVGALAGWRWIGVHPTRTGSGVVLGALPRGVLRDHLNLVLVTLDTTRADRIGAYGARDVETPTFDGLAQSGVLFEQAVSVAPLTLPAHSSLFTGKFPPEHGVRDNGGFFLGPEQLTLAEVLKARGYRTGGFVGAYVLDSKWGFNQGFDTYVDDFDLSQDPRRLSGSDSAARQRSRGQGPALDSAVSSDAVLRLDSSATTPHSPYRPPEPFASRYRGHPYNGEIAFADSQVGRIVSQLQSSGLYDRTGRGRDGRPWRESRRSR